MINGGPVQVTRGNKRQQAAARSEPEFNERRPDASPPFYRDAHGGGPGSMLRLGGWGGAGDHEAN